VRVLVTGGAGFIGSNLCRRLASSDAIEHVVVLDDFSTGNQGNLTGLDSGEVEVQAGSILDEAALARAVDGAAAIVHLAARPSVQRSLVDPLASHVANATGTLHVLEAARRTGAHVVAISSSSVYGATSALPKHEGLPARPMSPYAASKAMLTWRKVFSSNLVSSATRVVLTATVRSTSRP
jgi:UDP-glucose 4-epimerase